MNIELLKNFDTETLARWYNNLNYFTWPEDFIESCPNDFYLLPDYNENHSVRSKYIVVHPINKEILRIIGRKKSLEWLWVNTLSKTIQEFESWWIYQ